MRIFRRLNWFAPMAALALAGCGNGGDKIEKTQSPVAAPNGFVADANAAPKAAAGQPKMAPTPGAVLRDTELKDKPFVDAKTLKRLSKGASVTIVDRDGGWLKVAAAGQQGWVRLLHVSSQSSGSQAGGARDLESSAKIATGRAGSGNVVATTGIRGLNEEQLSTAKPNPEELKKLDGYTVSKEQAAEYALKQKLARRDVPYLPEPK